MENIDKERNNSVLEKLLKDSESNMNHFLKKLSEEVLNNEASLFIGTGVSMNSKLPSWKNLLTSCAEDLNIDYIEDMNLYDLAQYYANKHSDSELRKIVSNQINCNLESNELLDSLLDVGFSSIWTTNYDKLIETGLDKRKILNNVIASDKNLASIDKYDKVNIYKMNGDISDTTNMVLTKNDYENYTDKHSLFLTFLKREFVSNTFLFVGYSFCDAVVLECLSAIKNYIGTPAIHYAIMLVDENTTCKMEYFSNDLRLRYNIQCIFATKDEIPNVIKRLNKKIREKKVFISGAYNNVSESVNSFADSMSQALINKLYDSDYRIATGVGKRLGTYLTGYAFQYLTEKSKRNPSKYLSMRPFPFHLDLDESKKIEYRKYMQNDCSAAIFLFGQSASTTTSGGFEKTGHHSHGVYQEFKIAQELGLAVIPVGATGYEAEVIWNEVKNDINRYYYLSNRIDALSTEKDPNNLANLIVHILDDIAKNRVV